MRGYNQNLCWIFFDFCTWIQSIDILFFWRNLNQRMKNVITCLHKCESIQNTITRSRNNEELMNISGLNLFCKQHLVLKFYWFYVVKLSPFESFNKCKNSNSVRLQHECFEATFQILKYFLCRCLTFFASLLCMLQEFLLQGVHATFFFDTEAFCAAKFWNIVT